MTLQEQMYLRGLCIADHASKRIVIRESASGFDVLVRRGKRLDEAEYTLHQEALSWIAYNTAGKLVVMWARIPHVVLQHKDVILERWEVPCTG